MTIESVNDSDTDDSVIHGEAPGHWETVCRYGRAFKEQAVEHGPWLASLIYLYGDTLSRSLEAESDWSSVLPTLSNTAVAAGITLVADRVFARYADAGSWQQVGKGIAGYNLFQAMTGTNLLNTNVLNLFFSGVNLHQLQSKFVGVHQDVSQAKASLLARSASDSRDLLTLSGLRNALDGAVVGQGDAKSVLSQALYFHQASLRLDESRRSSKGNVLLVGPSGSGKTFLLETLASAVDIPMATIDASRITREGLVGLNPEDAIEVLLEKAEGDISKAERGIIFVDEIDKQFQDAQSEHGSLISGRVIQNQLLTLLQGTEVSVRYKDAVTKKTVNTKNILFVLGGSFKGLKEGIAEGAPITDGALLSYGMIPEFLGRIGYIAELKALDRDQLRLTLTHDDNAPIVSWGKLCSLHGLKLVITESAIERLLDRALLKETGVRGLHYELRQVISPKLAAAIASMESGDDNGRRELRITVDDISSC